MANYQVLIRRDTTKSYENFDSECQAIERIENQLRMPEVTNIEFYERDGSIWRIKQSWGWIVIGKERFLKPIFSERVRA